MFPPQLTVPPQKIPVRLDKFLVEKFPTTSRAFWKKHLLKSLRVDGRSPKKGLLLRGGESLQFLKTLSLETPPEADPSVEAKVLLEDSSFLIVEKPSGLPVHPLEAGERKTLVQGVLVFYPEIASVGDPREMGLVHRLDNETSGLVLIARTEEAYDFLREEFRKHRVEKEYLALVHGNLKKKREGTWEKIEFPIAHHPKNKKKMVVVEESRQEKISKKEPREAVTFYQVEKNLPHFTLLRVSIPTGVRHQIRVHLSHLGHPIVGDALYGGKGERLFLHAARLSFRHPLTFKKVECHSPLPEDLKSLLDRCILER